MEKTDVTKPPVPGSGDIPGDKGQLPNEKEIENRVRENLRAEYARKEQTLLERLDSYESKVQELEEKGRLSDTDRELLERLKGRKDDIEDQIKILETDPKYRAYNEKISRETNKAKEQAKAEARWEMSVDQMEDYIEEEAIREKSDPKELRKQLNAILADGKYKQDAEGNVILPHRRAKLAQRERLRLKGLEDKETELKQKELELKGPYEDGQASVRETSMDDLKKRGDTVGQARKLGLI